MEDVGPGHLPQPGVSHRHIEPVVSAGVRDLGEAGLAAGAGGRPDGQGRHIEDHQDREHREHAEL